MLSYVDITISLSIMSYNHKFIIQRPITTATNTTKPTIVFQNIMELMERLKSDQWMDGNEEIHPRTGTFTLLNSVMNDKTGQVQQQSNNVEGADEPSPLECANSAAMLDDGKVSVVEAQSIITIDELDTQKQKG